MAKDLKDKAIKIHGKDYVLVADRVNYFNEEYESGYIQTELVSEPDSKYIIVKGIVTPDVGQPDRKFTGYSQAVIGDGTVNKTAALENAETSAVGRALGFMGIGVIESIASGDEMHKASFNGTPTDRPASDKQKKFIGDLYEQKTGKLPSLVVDYIADEYSWVAKDLTADQASHIIEDLQAL